MQQKLVATKAILVDESGNVLLVRDSGEGEHENIKGKWSVPGGRMERGETPKEGLVREVKEETGLDIDAQKAKPLHVDHWGVNGDALNHPIVGIFYLIYIEKSDITLSKEHSEYEWKNVSDISFEECSKVSARAIDTYRKYAETMGDN